MVDVLGGVAAALVGLLVAGFGAVLLTDWRGLAASLAREQARMVGSYVSDDRRRRFDERQRRSSRRAGMGLLLVGVVVLVASVVGAVQH